MRESSPLSLPLEFWRVSSYGYPTPFSGNQKAHDVWSTLLTFLEHQSYTKLKEYWGSKEAPRRLAKHAVESWKAAFEEFGLLFVESRSNQINVTPAGAQLVEAAQKEDEEQFNWIGLNLLFRFPLRGIRRPKSPTQATSDLLPYRFLYLALLELDGYLWWSEFERVISRVFSTASAGHAVDFISLARATPARLREQPLPAPRRRGAFYNSLNQVMVHAGLNHTVLKAREEQSIYGKGEVHRRQVLDERWRPLVLKALGRASSTQCELVADGMRALPTAPTFRSEEDYFSYLGSRVEPATNVVTRFDVVEHEGIQVALLRLGQHYQIRTDDIISGMPHVLCALNRKQRVVLSHDLARTYFVEEKSLTSGGTVDIQIRAARPITNPEYFGALFREKGG